MLQDVVFLLSVIERFFIPVLHVLAATFLFQVHHEPPQHYQHRPLLIVHM